MASCDLLDEIVKKPRAAAILGVGIRTLERYVAAGLIPVIRYSARCVRFRRSDLETFLKRHLDGLPLAQT